MALTFQSITNARTEQRLLVGALVAFGFLLSTAARNERALFILPLQPAALTALARSPDAGPYTISFPGRGGRSGFAAPRTDARYGVPGLRGAVPAAVPAATPFLAGPALPLLAALAPGVLPRFAGLTPPLGDTAAGAPVGDTGAPFAPGLPATNGAPGSGLPGTGTPGTGGPGTGGPGTGGTSGPGVGLPDGSVTPPVPEPIEWTLLVIGLFAVAAALRRRRAQSITISSPVSRTLSN